MHKQKTQSKIIVAMSIVILALVALSATLTFAYFTAAKNSTSGTMTFGKIVMDSAALTLSDGDTSGHVTVSSGNITGLVPGCTVGIAGGTVSLGNNVDTYVRFKIEVSAAGVSAANMTAAFATLVATPASGGWIPNGTAAYDTGTASSPWFYVKVAAGDGTSAALTGAGLPATFQFPTTMGNDWQEKVVTFTLTAQAIQAEHLTDGTDAVPNTTVAAGNVATIASATAWPV